MAEKLYTDMRFWIDGANGTLTEITNSINQASLRGAMEIIEKLGLGETARTKYPSMVSASVPINGFVNSTTDAIFGPLIGNRTSISKTFQYYNGLKYYTGEAYPTEVEFSGSAGDLQAFSASLDVTGPVNRTSVSVA